MVPLYLCLDIGTSKVKGAIISEQGQSLYSIEQVLPANLDDIYRQTVLIIDQLLSAASIYGRVMCIGLATQMSGLVFLDANQRPLCDFIPGVISGTEESLSMIDTGALYQITGCPPEPEYPLVKMIDFARMNADEANRVKYIGGLKEYLLLRLTGSWITDRASASTTMIFDQVKNDWIQFNLLPWAKDVYPLVVNPWDVAGHFRNSQVPIIVGTGDGPAANISVGVLTPDKVVISLGTTAVLRWHYNTRVSITNGEFRQMLDSNNYFYGTRFIGSGNAILQAQKLYGTKLTEESLSCLPECILTSKRTDTNSPVSGPQMLASIYAGVLLPFVNTLDRHAQLKHIQSILLVGGGASDPNWSMVASKVYNLPVKSLNRGGGTLGVAILCDMFVKGISLKDAVMEVIEHGTSA